MTSGHHNSVVFLNERKFSDKQSLKSKIYRNSAYIELSPIILRGTVCGLGVLEVFIKCKIFLQCMKFKFLGSGGYLRIPRACCNCKICTEARVKGSPYERLGQSLFIEDSNILFDTPEDINTELNNHNVKEVEHLFYSHWHPDHTAGLRILETLKANKNEKPVNVYLTKNLKEDLKKKRPAIFYFESLDYCKIKTLNKIKINNINIEYVKLNNDFAYCLLITENKKKVIYCPCHSIDLIANKKLMNPDLLIINIGYFGKEKRNVTGFEKDNLPLIKKLKPKTSVFTHIEEIWNKNYDDYCKLEEKYKDLNIKFAFDGLTIKV